MRGWIFGLFGALIFSSTPVYAHDGHVVINSFQIAGETSTDEFIELYNPTTFNISLAGYRLSRKTASGSLSNLLTTFPELVLEPGKTIMITHTNCTFESDLLYSTSSSIAADNTIILFADQGKTIIDKVGMGKATDFEGLPVANPAAKEILARKEGKDTENNFYDFGKEEVPVITPGSSESPQIYLTEVMPNPKGTDTENEWIEIYNAGARADIGGVALSDKIGSVKKFVVPAGTIIEKESYLAFYSKQTRISLNNDGDIVELYDKDGTLLDTTGDSYGKSAESSSYAFDGEKWAWTMTATPGGQNTIQEIDQAKVAAKTTAKTAAKKTASKTKKAAKPKATNKKLSGNVLGETDENEDLFEEQPERVLSEKDRLLGYVLIIVALVGGLGYTVFVNREKLLEVFNEERKGYAKTWRRIREKLPRR